jgi:1-aminocyclopropane-1-carboxylate deaminase
MKEGFADIMCLEKAVITKVETEQLKKKLVEMDVLRLDELHPVLSGNKYFKLKYYLLEAIEQQKNTIVTFGGAFSNHIVSTAFMAKNNGLKSVGLIRGEKPLILSHTLQHAMAYGMEVKFLSRQAYAKKEHAGLSDDSNNYIINEGGEGDLGIKGASEILQLVKKEAYTHIVCAVGTGTMLKGLSEAIVPGQSVIAIPILKGFDSISNSGTMRAQTSSESVVFKTNYHWGGYAKTKPGLLNFMNRLYTETGIPTDFVYTGKLFYACMDLIEQDYFLPGTRLLVIHSGGLQGNGSLPPQTLDF